MQRLRTTVGIAACAAMLILAGCSGSDSPTAPGGGGTGGGGTGGGGTGGGGTGSATITITASGVSPSTLTVSPGTRVTFVNNDSRVHEMNSDPHPTHGDCPEIDQVGFLQAGQSKQTGNLNAVRTCGYHDHGQPSNSSLMGTIRIQ